MNKELYISPLRINSRISETVLEGYHIVIDGATYERISRAPIGRRPVQRLINEETNTRITIYA